MSTKTKAEIGAVLSIVGAALVAHYVSDTTLALGLVAGLAHVAGWLGYAKPGQAA